MDNNLDNSVPENVRDVFTGSAKAGKQLEQKTAGSEAEVDANENKSKGENKMENAELANQVRAEVQAIFAEKDAQQKVEAKINTLEAEKSSLGESVASLKTEKENLEGSVASLTTEKTQLSAKVEELEKEKASLSAAKASVEAELAEIKKERITATRKGELSKAGLLIEDAALAEKQIAKISGMTDEQFVEYTAELGAVSAKKCEKKDEAKCGDDKKKKGCAEEDSAKASVEKVDPENIGQLFTQAIASAQAPSGDSELHGKYAQM